MKKLTLTLVLLSALCGAQTIPQVTTNLLTFPGPVAPQVQNVFAQVVGSPGVQTYYVWVVGDYTIGNSSPSPAAVVRGAPAVLTASNYILVSWQPPSGVVPNSYDVLLTTTDTTPSGACNCAAVVATAGPQYSIVSNTLQSYTVATYSGATTFNVSNQAVGGAESRLTFAANAGGQFWIDNLKGITALHPAITPTSIEGTQFLDQYTSLGAALSAIGSTATPLACTTHISVATSATIPANVNLVAERGCLLTVASGQTLTIGGLVTAGAYPIFAGPGTVSFSGNLSQPSAWIEWWGAACDGSTDDYSALQAAFTQAAGAVPIVIPASATCVDKTAGLTYQDGFHLDGANYRTGESSLKFEFAAGSSGTVNLLAPASGQTAADSVIRGVFFDASNMTTTGAAIVVDDDVNGNSAVRAWDHYYGPVSSHTSWGAIPRVIGINMASATGGTSFYQNVVASTFSQLTTDVGMYGLSGNQINAVNLTGDTFFDGNDFDGSTSCSSSPYGAAIDLGPYAASDTFANDVWSDPVCSVILHGTTAVAQPINVVGGYVDGGISQPWLATVDIGNGATSSYQSILHIIGVGDLPTSGGVSAYIYAPPGAASVSSGVQNIAGGTVNGTVDTTPNTVAYLGNIGSNWGTAGGQGDQVSVMINPLGGSGDSALVEGLVGQTNAAQCDWGTLSLGSDSGAFVARCRTGATAGSEVLRASASGLNWGGGSVISSSSDVALDLSGTVSITASGTALAAVTGTASIAGATTSMACIASAAGTADADAFPAHCYVSSAGTVTVQVVTRVTDASPPAVTYNIRVIQ